MKNVKDDDARAGLVNLMSALDTGSAELVKFEDDNSYESLRFVRATYKMPNGAKAEISFIYNKDTEKK